MWQHTGRSFRVRSADGQTFDVFEDVRIIEAGSSDDPSATVEGLKRLTTAEGHHVNWLSDNDFEILGVGLLASDLRVKRL